MGHFHSKCNTLAPHEALLSAASSISVVCPGYSRVPVIHAVDKKKARLNCIHHLLSQVPYQEVEREAVTLPDRAHNSDYLRNPVPEDMFVPQVY